MSRRIRVFRDLALRRQVVGGGICFMAFLTRRSSVDKIRGRTIRRVFFVLPGNWTSGFAATLIVGSIWHSLFAGTPRGVAASMPKPRSGISAWDGTLGPCHDIGSLGTGASDNDLIPVAGARAWLGDDHGQVDEKPRRRVWVAGFAMQRHEVTWAEYCGCVRSGHCSVPKHFSLLGDRLPVTGVSYAQAKAYCAFRGLRLPTEQEWEKAAAGLQGLRYPWGDEADCGKANYGSYDGQGPCAGENPGRIIAVASRPAGRSPYGFDDMAGNVWEWTLGRGGKPVLRGGSCCSVFLLPRVSNRLVLPGSYRDGDIGFRCAGLVGAGKTARNRGVSRVPGPEK